MALSTVLTNLFIGFAKRHPFLAGIPLIVLGTWLAWYSLKLGAEYDPFIGTTPIEAEVVTANGRSAAHSALCRRRHVDDGVPAPAGGRCAVEEEAAKSARRGRAVRGHAPRAGGGIEAHAAGTEGDQP